VTRVIQMGIPSDKAQYVHRLGRTGRAGKNGSGLIVLTKCEMNFVHREARDLDIKERKSNSKLNETLRSTLYNAIRRVSYSDYSRGYSAMLGYYNSNTKRCGWRSKGELVQFANRFATEVCGFSVPPALMKKTVGKMGLRDQRELRVQGRRGVPMEETLQPGKRFESFDGTTATTTTTTTTTMHSTMTSSSISSTSTNKRKICRFFGTERGCRFGEECRFLHVSPDDNNNSTNVSNAMPKGGRNRRRRHGGRGGSSGGYSNQGGGRERSSNNGSWRNEN
jgi:superfamily II DNA/RNA helicase